MAFVWKHPQSKFWIARFVDRHGVRRNRSTRETIRKKAERIADSYEEAARKKRTARQVRDVIVSLHKEITGEDLPAHSFRQFVASWLDRKTPETAPATLAFYRNALGKFMHFLDEKANGELVAISREDISNFRNQEAKTLAGKTVNHDLKVLKMLFRAARRDGAITEDPCEFVDTIRERGGSKRRPFTIPQMQAILKVADNEWKSMILFGLYTGQRLGDVATLTWQNVDLIRGEIRLVTRKTGKQMILPIAAPLRKHLEGVKSGDKPTGPLHPRAFAIVSEQGKSGHLSNWFAVLLASAGLREKKPHRKTGEGGVGRGRGSSTGGLSFHCLRHTAVSLMKDAGIPAAAVMELVGHDSEQMNEHYTHVGKEALEKATGSLPDIT
ncbi:MAG: tyrosine-type recombinase/integrase [Chthoniobacteraceae bacterium]